MYRTQYWVCQFQATGPPLTPVVHLSPHVRHQDTCVIARGRQSRDYLGVASNGRPTDGETTSIRVSKLVTRAAQEIIWRVNFKNRNGVRWYLGEYSSVLVDSTDHQTRLQRTDVRQSVLRTGCGGATTLGALIRNVMSIHFWRNRYTSTYIRVYFPIWPVHTTYQTRMRSPPTNNKR